MTARFTVADVFDGLATLEDHSVDLVVTSPPFLALRSYLPADHPDKHKELGSEPTPAAFIDSLLAVTAELRRVLAPHGSVCVELGDTYAGSTTPGNETGRLTWDEVGGQRFQFTGEAKAGNGWPLAKSLSLIPEAFRFALAYGINPHTGQESPAGKWRIRNVIRWVRPNPPVGALGDKWRPATSELVVATVSGKRFWDDLATRRPHQNGRDQRPLQVTTNHGGNKESRNDHGEAFYSAGNPSGAPLLDWWNIPPGGYNGAHYAVFLPELVEPCVKAMCPQRVCVVCGEPSRRIVGDLTLDSYRSSKRIQTIKAVALADEHGLTDEHIAAIRAFGTSDAGKALHINNGAGKNTAEVNRLASEAKSVLGGYFREFVMNTNADRTTTGWSDCGHDSWRPGRVLDPFAGSGTTLLVADALGYDAVGFDIDERNRVLFERRRDDRAFTKRRQMELL